jgi:nitroreductase
MSNNLENPGRECLDNDVLKNIYCSLPGQNMMLATRSLGIGSCWIGLASVLGQDPATLANLGVPDRCKLEGSIIFGYPVKSDQKVPKRDKDVILKWIE